MALNTDSIHHEQTVIQLSKEEQENPQMVLHEFFDFAHLPQVKTMLWQWLACAVTGNIGKLEVDEREEIIILYEKLGRLVEACWVMKG